MPTIAGASQYLNAATLSNLRGTAGTSPTLLGSSGTSATSLLDAARVDTGVGLSSRARALNKQFLSSTGSNYNSLFSSTNSAYLSVEQLQQQVLALRSSLPDSAISSSAGSFGDDGSVAEDDTTGTNVDIEA